MAADLIAQTQYIRPQTPDSAHSPSEASVCGHRSDLRPRTCETRLLKRPCDVFAIWTPGHDDIQQPFPHISYTRSRTPYSAHSSSESSMLATALSAQTSDMRSRICENASSETRTLCVVDVGPDRKRNLNNTIKTGWEAEIEALLNRKWRFGECNLHN